MRMDFFGKRRLAQAFFLLAALVCHRQPVAAQNMPTEQSMRAAMVFNFLKFTEFPPGSIAKAQRMQLCVAAEDPRQVEALGALSGRKAGGRELAVAPLASRDDVCQVLYVDSRQRWDALEGPGALLHTLTISAYPGFARDGGMIEIALQADGARFDINLTEARRAGFHFAPQLLQLARHIYE